MKIIGVTTLSVMPILTSDSTLPMIIKMVDVHEEQMVLVVHGVVKTNIVTSFAKYAQENFPHNLVLDCGNSCTQYHLQSKHASLI